VGRAEIRRRRLGHPGHFGEGDVRRPEHHRVALLVETASPGPPGQLRVLPGGEGGSAGPAELVEPLDDHGSGGHVDAEREGLGGEHHLQQPGGEALLHRLPERRHQPGVVGRHAVFEALQPLAVPEDLQVVGCQSGGVDLGDAPHHLALALIGQAQPVPQALTHRVVAGGSGEDEHDGRQQVVVVERLHDLGAPRRPVGQTRPAGAPTGGRRLQPGGPPHRLVHAQPLAPGLPSLEQRHDRGTVVGAPVMDGEVVPQDDRSASFHHHVGRPPHRAEPSPQLRRVGHRGRQADEGHLRRTEHEHFLPHPAPVRVLEVVDLVQHHHRQPLQEIGSGQQHVAQHLGGHHHHRGVGAQRGVAGEEPDPLGAVLGRELTVLLVGQRLERRGVEGLATGGPGQPHGVGRHQRLARPGGGRDQHRTAGIEGVESGQLKRIGRERERVEEAPANRRRRLAARRRRTGPPQRPSSFPMPMATK